MKQYTFTIIIITTVVLGIGLIWWTKANQTKEMTSPDSNVISMSGVHYHPELEIYVKGEKLEIPKSIGLVGGHKPMHTHDDVPIVHLEYQAKVTSEDTRLGRFFEVWGKD